MKKVISLFLSLAMLLSIVSVVDFSAYADVQTGSCGDNVTYSLDTETGVLTISGTGDMYSYGPFYENTNIKSVIIESGVTSIGDCAFEDCYFTYENFVNNSNVELDDSSKPTIVDTDTGGFCIKDNELVNMRPTYAIGEITIPNSVTSIDSSAFYGCSSLTSVTMSNSVTSIGNPAFENCTSLTSIEVSDNNGNYSSVDGVLFNKDKSELITYPAGKTDSEYVIPNSVISIGDSAFENCTSLTSVTIPDSVTIIGRSAFENCTSLTSVTIPNSVTSIGDYAFSNCTSLKSIEVSENNKNYASIDGVLFNKDKSELVTYPAGKTDSEYVIPNSVTSIGYSAFENCTSLTSVTIPDSVTSIDYSAFENCTSLTSVTIPNSVTSIGSSAFYNTAYYNDKSNWDKGVLYLSNCLINTNDDFGSTTDYTIKDGTRFIADSAFSGCTSLTSVTIPKSITYISDDAFENCGFINVKYEGTTKEFLKIRNIENNKALIIGRHYDVFNFNSFDVPCKQSEHLDVSNYLYSFIPDLISKRSKENNEDVLIKNGDIYVDGVNVGKLDIYYSYFSNCYCDDPYGESCYESDYERLHSASIYIQEEYTDDDGAISYIDICHDEFKINFSNDSDYNESDKQYVNDFVKKLTLAKPQYYEMDYEEYTNELFNGNDIFNYIDKCASKYYNSLIDDPTIKVTVGSGAGGIEGGINPGYGEGGANLAVFKNNVFYGEYYLKNEYDENGCKIWSEGFIPVLIIPDSIADDEIESYILQKVKKDYEGRQNFKFNAISKGAVENGLPVEDGYTLKTNYADVDSIIIARRTNTQKPSTPAENPTAPTTPTQPIQPSQPSTTPNTPTPTQPTAPVQPTPAPTQPTAPAQAVKKPKSTSIKKAKGSKKAVALEWKKVSGVKGYQVQVATDKKFKKNKKTVTIKKQKTTKTTVKKLKAKKKYYVRVRTYKIVNGKKVYSSWSKVKSVKTK